MFGVFLLAVITGLLLEVRGLPVGLTEKNTGAVFVSQQAADTVLRRQRRYNSGHLEEWVQDNLERECREETCSMEEAREVFENNEKTMQFWIGHIDGDQCQPPPCQNEGRCEDGISSYICWCKPNFSGKNCEIELTKQCSVNNGGCSHFCVMRTNQPLCQCPAGYKLGSDKRNCEPTGPFSCGKVKLDTPSTSATRSIRSPRSSSITSNSERSSNPSNALQDSFISDILTYDTYDYYDLPTNDSDLTNTSVASAVEIRSLKSDSDSSKNPAQTVLNSSDITETATEKKQPPSSAFFPTLPTITEQENTDQRIVGGNEATPGEIPWQVTLMSYSKSYDKLLPFCGGSLLSEVWVISAAHCLMKPDIIKNGYTVRVGEHDVNTHEGPESDHAVAEQHIHHSYNYSKSPYNNDIVLLKLTNPVVLSNQRRPICLGPKHFTEGILRESSSSLVSGWGALKFLGLEATKLQKLKVPYVERTVCKQSSRDHVTRFMFCAGYQSELKDSCQGDSGGPHATNFKGTWFLTGIVSWGEECARDGKYGIYTRISQYYPWISQKTGIQVTN